MTVDPATPTAEPWRVSSAEEFVAAWADWLDPQNLDAEDRNQLLVMLGSFESHIVERLNAQVLADELVAAGLHEAAEDRRIASLMCEPKNRATLERRAEVTEALAAALSSERAVSAGLRAEVERLRAALAAAQPTKETE